MTLAFLDDTVAHLIDRTGPVVRSLVETIVPPELGEGLTFDRRVLLEDTHVILLSRLEGMPRSLGVPLLMATLAFDGWCRSSSRGGGGTVAIEARRDALDGWRNAPVGALREFVVFYEKMSIFIFTSLLEERGHIPDLGPHGKA